MDLVKDYSREMQNSTAIHEKVYVWRIKQARNWKANDCAYGYGCEGKPGLQFGSFRSMCDRNNTWFQSNKVNYKDNADSCTWGQVCLIGQDNPPVGNPRMQRGPFKGNGHLKDATPRRCQGNHNTIHSKDETHREWSSQGCNT